MLDFAVDPGWIALAGTVGCGVVLKTGENILAKRKVPTVKSVQEPVVPKHTDAYLCSVWEIRHKEANPFYGSGLRPVALAEMTVCFDPKCANCATTHEAIQQIKNREFAEALRKERAKAAIEKEKSEALKAAARKRAAEVEAKKFSYVNGMKVRRPREVPFGAKGEIHRDERTWRDYIVWTWPSPKSGKVIFFKQPIDVENIEEINAGGMTVLRWTAVYDPVTGEHLGDYRHSTDAGTEIRNPVEKLPNKFEQEKFEKQMKELMHSAKPMYYNMGSKALEAPEIGSRKAKR